MTTRREFLTWLGAAVAASGYSWPQPTARLDRIGIQLYTLRRLMEQDVEGTLAALAEIGYREVEFAGYFDHPPARIRGMLETHGLSAPAAHVGILQSAEAWHRVLDAAAEVGHQYVVIPWTPEPQRTLDGYRRLAERFNEAATAAQARGMTFAYHNHDFEFVPLSDGRLPFDLLLEETDPTLVQFEMDLFWITKGGEDPVDYLDRYPGRFPLVHVKDMAADGAMVDVGAGGIDFAGIFRHAGDAIRHYFVEHDNPPDPLATARRSHAHLRGLER